MTRMERILIAQISDRASFSTSAIIILHKKVLFNVLNAFKLWFVGLVYSWCGRFDFKVMIYWRHILAKVDV